MKERPILFSGPMVRAILDGRKTQTRRVFKETVSADCIGFSKELRGGVELWRQRFVGPEGADLPKAWTHRCPYGQPGDRLWVRETFSEVHPCQVQEGRYSKDGRAGIPGPPPVSYRVIYRADGDTALKHHGIEKWPFRAVGAPSDPLEAALPEFERSVYWGPSIHMPRWASRLTLEVVSVRVERLHDISEEDAKAEGVEMKRYTPRTWIKQPDCYRDSFIDLWGSINGAASWGTNPWVWVVEFKRIQP